MISVVPTIQKDDFAKDWWILRHQEKVAERKAMKGQVDLLFLGDSITHAWEYTAPNIWEKCYAKYNTLNLGFDGDRTENLLWRLQNGAIDDISPGLIILLIGTNNAGHRQETSQHTALGIKAIIEELHKRLPTSKILLMAIFPRSKKPKQQLRKLVDGTNQIIKRYADGDKVIWKDINHLFLDDYGMLHESVMPDFLHPSELQYQIWADEIDSLVKDSLSK
jgi:beta-glucosidase